MKIKEKCMKLKDGRECVLYTPQEKDAADLLAHMKITSEETEFMMRYPEEILTTEAEEAEYLNAALEKKNELFVCAGVEGKMIATGSLKPVRDHIRCRHRAVFGISIQKEYWELGIGGMIIQELLSYAPKMAYEQIELEVACENQRAIHLYQKYGFNIYGTRKHTFRQKDGRYADCYLMMAECGRKKETEKETPQQTTLCYIEKEGRYLMLNRLNKDTDVNRGKWIGVGGHLEKGESPEECLLREVKEETGLTLTSWSFRGILTFASDIAPAEYIYLYTSDEFTGQLTKCREGILRWVRKDRVPDLNLWEGDLIFLRLLERKEPFFSLKLYYKGYKLIGYALNGKHEVFF